jgi:arylsulfatase A-like enzyme
VSDRIAPVRALCITLCACLFGSASFTAEVLPHPAPPFKGRIGTTDKDSRPDWPRSVKPPSGAPNVILILLDDAGFSATGTFGGPIDTPALDQLAAQGLRYSRFHVSAQCAPTRAALLSGRNDHRVGFGAVEAGGYPGYNKIWPKSVVPIPEVLRQNGYSTAAFGKWHNTPGKEVSPVGPFDRWPTGLGFEYFYGFMAGSDSQYEPELYRDTTPAEPPTTAEKGYHFTTDITNEGIAWIHTHQSLAPDRPYFLYFAPGATHAPNQVAAKWIEPYRGHFDQGWDRLREEIFARQRKLGIVPANAQLTARPKEMPAWDSLPADERKLLARQMEVYAGFMAQTDYEIGRLIKAAQSSPSGDNTLILYIAGDNGASSESGVTGSEDEFFYDFPSEPLESRIAHMGELGSIRYPYNQYAAGWAWAMSSPFKWQKLIASDLGGTRDPLVVAWPARIKDRGGLRTQYTHINDVASTIYQVSGITFPSTVNGVKQVPLDGVSFAPSFDDATAPSRHRLQIYEQWGNRAIYKDGWLASAQHLVPWAWSYGNSPNTYEQDRWELYNLDEDFSQAHDLAARYPQKLKAMRALFNIEARRNSIYPLGGANFSSTPASPAAKREYVFYPGLPRLPVDQAPDFTHNHRITANFLVPAAGAEGVLVSYGWRYGGFVLYVKNNRVTYEHNFANGARDVITSDVPLPRGQVEVVLAFTREDPRPFDDGTVQHSGGDGRLYINGSQVGEHHIQGVGGLSSGSFNIGQARVSPVSNKFQMPFAFTGTLNSVRVEVQ